MDGNITRVSELIDRWPSRGELAKDADVQLIVVQRWAARGSIPAKYHFRIMKSAKRRGLKVDFEDMARAHSSS